MGKPNAIIADAAGLQTQPNELTLPAGSLTVAENVEITRDGVVEVARGFEDFSSNLPDFTPEQLIVVGGVAYLNLDSGLWYHDGTRWLRKRGDTGFGVARPHNVAVVGDTLYLTTGYHLVYSYNLTTGRRTIVAGVFNSTGSTDGTGTAARFSTPYGICTDGTNLYVGDVTNCTIRKIVIATGVVTTLAGTAGASGSTDGVGSAARFTNLRGLCYTGGCIYAVDTDRHTIRKIVVATANVTTFAGSDGVANNTDGVGSAARFNIPNGICTDDANLYVGEAGNDRVRAIAIATATVTTLAGSSAGDVDDVGTSAKFNNPYGVCTDGVNVFVADSGNYKVKKIVISTRAVTTIAGSGSSGDTDAIGALAKFVGIIFLQFLDDDRIVVVDNSDTSLRLLYVDTAYVATLDSTEAGFIPVAPSLPFTNGFVVGPE